MHLYPFLLLACIITLNTAFSQPILIYPGDANNDGEANHYDLLPIGIAYSNEGPQRIFPSPAWLIQQAQGWTPQLLPVSGIDLATVDCSGDGLIDSLDAALIAFNYDSTQNDALPPPFPYIELLKEFCLSCPQPEIVVTFDKDTVGNFDTFSANFVLRYPTDVPPQLGALGIAFDVEYDYNPDFVLDSLTRIYPDTMPDNRMYVFATHTKAVSNGLLPLKSGNIEFAAAGKGENVYTTTTPLFTAEFVIEDMIIRDGNLENQFSFKISNVLILNDQEQIIGLGGIKLDTVTIGSTAAKSLAERRAQVRIAPNPARDVLSVESLDAPIEKIEIVSLTGEIVLSMEANNLHSDEVPVAGLAPGVWMAVVRTKMGSVTRRFVKN